MRPAWLFGLSRLGCCAITLGLVFAALPARAQEAVAIPEPLSIEGSNALVLAADPRFTPADRGTVEFIFAINPSQPAAPQGDPVQLCIAEHGSGDKLNWRLAMSSDGQVVMISRTRGSGVFLRKVEPSSSGFVHVALVTSGGISRMIAGDPMRENLDEGGLPLSGFSLSYPEATPEGLPINFGCSKGPSARVWMSSFRIWDKALTAEDLQYTAKFDGLVAGREDLATSLLAYSDFTTQAKNIRLTGEKIRFTSARGVEGGEPFFLRRPQGQELTAVYLWGFFANGLMADLRVEYDAVTRGFALSRREDTTPLSLPTVMPRNKPNNTGMEADFLLSKYNDAVRTKPAGDIAVQTLHDQFVSWRRQARTADFGVVTKDPQDQLFEGMSDSGQPEALFARRYAASLSSGERITRINGLANSRGVMGWSVETNIPRLMGIVNGPSKEGDLLQPFSLSIPPGARFEGIAGRRNGDGIKSLAFAYSFPATPATDVLSQVSQGLWIDRNIPEPQRDKSTRRLPHGTYEDQLVYRVTYNAARDKLIVALTGKYGRDRSILIQAYQRARGNPDGNEWVWDVDTSRRLVLFPDAIRLIGKDDTPFTGGRTLVRVADYEKPPNDQLPWGATFSLDHRPNAVEANFKSYFPFNMFAKNIQATSGAAGMIFDMPDAGSRNYYTTGSRVIVPFGLHYRIENSGSERSDLTKIDTEYQRQSSWTLGLGLHVGIPLIASFDEDGSHQESQETVDKAELSFMEDRATVSHYALVLDPARMKLSREFRSRLAALRARFATRQPIDWPEFFRHFGTHYTNAVTYGGMAWAETTVNNRFSSTQSGTTDKISVSTKFPLDEMLEVGIKANNEQSESSKSAGGLSLTNSTYGTYGGNFSKGGGWSVQRGEELPLLLDLRPLDELLSPAFFDDPLVYRELRQAMHEALAEYNWMLAQKVKRERPWASDADPSVIANVGR